MPDYSVIPEWRNLRARTAALQRHRPDDPELSALRRQPLTAEQIRRLRAILAPPSRRKDP